MAGYNPPSEVTSPKRKWSLISVLEDEGPNQYAIALGRWENKPVLAVRWNGNEHSVGSPQSRGLPTWFILPDRFNEPLTNSLKKDKQDLVKHILGGS